MWISSPKARKLDTQAEQLFQSESEAGKDQYSSSRSQEGGVPSYSVFVLFRSSVDSMRPVEGNLLYLLLSVTGKSESSLHLPNHNS